MIPPLAIYPSQAAQKKWGIPASVTIAQFGLESGWGAHMPPGSNNPFGIKSLPGQPSVTVATHEFVGGRYILVQAAFRKFASLDEAFDAHAELLATGRPYAAARATLAGGITEASVNAFAEALTGVYATSPTYGADLIKLMRADNLYQYDQVPVPSLAPTVVLVQPSPVPAPQPASSQTSIGAIGQPPVAPPPPGQMSQPDFTPSQIALPSQVAAFVQQFGTHLGAVAGGALASWGAIQPGQETQFSAIAGGIAVWGVSLLINYIAQTLRHRQAQTAVAVALASPPAKVS